MVPTFEEVDEAELEALREEFWVRWVERCRLEDNPALAPLERARHRANRTADTAFGRWSRTPMCTFPLTRRTGTRAAPCRERLSQLLLLPMR